ncbi:Uncharacterised protein [Serratia fonticola]|uniref:Uncharacterized protein n=1 Tax=Serratia fonticola TaxID=47917 RepID=A0A4U9UKT2_SERFO|nr:Uncharacterised protein [Serratia fonticola]
MELINHLLLILLHNLPAASVEAVWPAVQLMLPLIGDQRVWLAIDAQAGMCNTVGIAPDRGPEISSLMQVVLRGLASQQQLTLFP